MTFAKGLPLSVKGTHIKYRILPHFLGQPLLHPQSGRHLWMVPPGERVAGSAAAAQGTEVKNQYARRRGTRSKECMTVTAVAVAEMLARFPRPDFDSAQLIRRPARYISAVRLAIMHQLGSCLALNR